MTSLAGGIIEYLADGSWTKRLHPGWAAHAGVAATLLARSGFTGPETVFEGAHGFYQAFAGGFEEPRLETLLGSLGRTWELAELTLKPYPCGSIAQPYMDCALRLRERRVDPAQIVAIRGFREMSKADLSLVTLTVHLARLFGADARLSGRDRLALGRSCEAEGRHDEAVAHYDAALRLAKEVSAELTLLAMPHARLEIAVSQTEAPPPEDGAHGPLRVGERWLRFTASGVDEVEFLLAANTGAEPRPLNKGASGGELSRVMLALEVALAGTSPVPTFVFDEVDAGVGGTAAIEVGRRLAQLAQTAQVLVVTHLPQVAAYADRHVVVEKSSDGTVTSSGLTVLDPAERERELSRMLAGQTDSDTALAHARELLEVAQPARALG